MGTIIGHEWRLLSTDPSTWILIAVFAAAIACGTLNWVRWVSFQQDVITQARQEETERFRRHETEIARIYRERRRFLPSPIRKIRMVLGAPLAHAMPSSRWALLPRSPSARATSCRNYFKVTTDAKETMLAASEIENPHRLLTGRFDLAFVLIYLYPLLILALAYNLLSIENEQGTLVLTLSQPVSVRTLVAAKVALRCGVFLAAVALMTAVAMVASGVTIAAPGAFSRLLMWEATDDVAKRVAVSLAGLAVPTVVIGGLAFVGLRRYSVAG